MSSKGMVVQGEDVIHVINQPTDNNNSNIYNDNNDVTLSPTFIHTKVIEEQRPTSSTGDSDFDGHFTWILIMRITTTMHFHNDVCLIRCLLAL